MRQMPCSRKGATDCRVYRGKKTCRMSQGVRDDLPGYAFGLSKERKYPVDTRRRAISAKGRAKQQLNKGNLTKKQYDRIIRKADNYLKGCPKRTTAGATVGLGCPNSKMPLLAIAAIAGAAWLLYRATK